MEANLLASLPLYLGVEAQTVPVHPLHIGSGVIGGDQPSSVPGAACGQENRNKVTCNKNKTQYFKLRLFDEKKVTAEVLLKYR